MHQTRCQSLLPKGVCSCLPAILCICLSVGNGLRAGAVKACYILMTLITELLESLNIIRIKYTPPGLLLRFISAISVMEKFEPEIILPEELYISIDLISRPSILQKPSIDGFGNIFTLFRISELSIPTIDSQGFGSS